MPTYQIVLVILTILKSLISCTEPQQYCRAIALSGGGTKGAYEAGLLYGLLHSENEKDYYYDVVTGVSAGAINTGAMVMWDKEQSKEMSEWILEVWNNITATDIYEHWSGGLISGLFKHSGLYDSSPLIKFVQDRMLPYTEFKRKFVISAVDVNTGNYITFDENIPFEDLPIVVTASSSIPMVFPYVKYKDHMLMDGGTAWNTNIVSAVDKCRDIVDDDSKVILDVVLLYSANLPEIDNSQKTIWNYLRKREIKSYYNTLHDIQGFQVSRPNIQFRHLFIPSQPLESLLKSMNFDPKHKQSMVELGIKDARAYLETLQVGHSFNLLSTWSGDEHVRGSHDSFDQFAAKNIYNNDDKILS